MRSIPGPSATPREYPRCARDHRKPLHQDASLKEIHGFFSIIREAGGVRPPLPSHVPPGAPSRDAKARRLGGRAHMAADFK